MSLWEYKIISSGRGGFAAPAMLEKFINDLGRDEWEIIDFRSPPDNPLAFTGLARRSTQRDWTLEDAAAAAAKVEAEKLRAEFAAKFQAATSTTSAAEEKSASFIEEKSAPDGGFRKPVDTSRDSDPDAHDDEAAEKDEWDQLAAEDELPSFFDALKPHMRRNQRGAGMSVGTDYLAKKWDLAEEDIKGALVECGMQIPADENAKPTYVEYDGDLYWVNINRRGEVWINTREKPRPVFRVVQGIKVAPETMEEPKPEIPAKRSEFEDRPDRPERNDRPERQDRPERGESRKPPATEQRLAEDESAEKPTAAVFQTSAAKKQQANAPSGNVAPLPSGLELLNKIRPLMRRNRRGPGGSGSATFLARALKCSEADLVIGFEGLGLKVPAAANDQLSEHEIAGDIWWLNQDSRGGLWINGREKLASDGIKPADEENVVATAPADASVSSARAESSVTVLTESSADAAAKPAPVVASAEQAELLPNLPIQSLGTESNPPSAHDNVLASVRLLLKETKTGSVAGKIERVAGAMNSSPEELTAALLAAGLKVPEKLREKPVFVEHAGEIFWLNKNSKGELWVNAKTSKYAERDSEDAEGGGSGTAEEVKRPARRVSAPRTKKPADPAT